ncbi:WAT1-related protein [Platanthera guangdongensis]|uniref:WAT1-related protein n=1 Tax=Platanthera guangdongensis TaxID=2320717 RepID=A0ABR2MV65_9ASPA
MQRRRYNPCDSAPLSARLVVVESNLPPTSKARPTNWILRAPDLFRFTSSMVLQAPKYNAGDGAPQFFSKLALWVEASVERPEWKEPWEDLLVISQKWAEMSADEFWVKCEGIVQNLEDRWQEIPMGTFIMVVIFRKEKIVGTLVRVAGAMILTFLKGMELNFSTGANLLKPHSNGGHDQTTLHHDSGDRIMGSILAVASCFSPSI